MARRLNLGYSYDDELAYQAKLSKLFEGKYKAEFDKRMDVAKQQIQAGQDVSTECTGDVLKMEKCVVVLDLCICLCRAIPSRDHPVALR